MLYSHRINEVQLMGILMNVYGVSYAQFFPARVVVGYVKALLNGDGNRTGRVILNEYGASYAQNCTGQWLTRYIEA